MGELKINWEDLALELRGDVLEGIKPFVEGVQEDLQQFGAAIAKDLVRAVRDKREDLLEELGDQLQGLAEVNRIRLVNASWAQIKNILAMAGRVAMKAIAAVAV